MVMKYLEGDKEGALKIQLESIDLINALFSEVNPIPVKKAVELMGLCGGTLRRPLTEIEPANLEKLKKAMTDYGILN
jgi:4-hydroxy-tetrahydrodipicolinate synthase